jgi:hypothetical protein
MNHFYKIESNRNKHNERMKNYMRNERANQLIDETIKKKQRKKLLEELLKYNTHQNIINIE